MREEPQAGGNKVPGGNAWRVRVGRTGWLEQGAGERVGDGVKEKGWGSQISHAEASLEVPGEAIQRFPPSPNKHQLGVLHVLKVP